MIQPTYLYIKQHTITGKLYFGKTTRKDPVKYNGSGIHWKNHIKVHGKEQVETLWYCQFIDQEELTRFALMCSEQWDIVKSDLWLNCKQENGIDGTPKGIKFTAEHRANMSKPRTSQHRANMSKPRTAQHRANIAKSNIGKHHSIESKIKMQQPKSEEAKINMQKPRSKISCPHCIKVGGSNVMKRWNFDNCREIL